MTVLNNIRRTIFWLTVAFIVTSILALTVGQVLPVEFKDRRVQSDYYSFVFTALPFAFLLTLTGTVKKKNTKGHNLAIGVLTVLSAILCFFILVGVMFSIGFGAWINEAVLYRSKANKNVSINQQIFDVGALGYGGHRTAQLTPFLGYFQTVKQIDTANIDKTQWTYVNEEGDLRFP